MRELTAGEPLMVIELAERLGLSPDSTSKHLALLRQAGLVQTGRNRLNQLHPALPADPTEKTLDLGFCLLRLKTVP